MKVNITEKQYDNLIIVEAENLAYDRFRANGNNIKAIWDEIDRKQKILQDEVFGELSDRIYNITVEKAKQMGQEYMEIPRNMFRAGNDKLPEGVLVVNMSSSLMCPSYYLGLCTITNGACYAQRSENQYSDTVLPNRWKTDLMHTQMLQQYQNKNKKPMRDFFRLVELYIQLGNAYAENLYRKEVEELTYRYGRELTDVEKNLLRVQQSKTKITDIRLNETGDFQCQLAVNLWDKFAAKVKRKYGINTHAYTARNLDFSNVKNIAINASHTGINLGKTPMRMFKAVSDDVYNKLVGGDKVRNGQPELAMKEDGTYFYKCPCRKGHNTCDRCGVCFNKNETGKPYTIFVRYHDMKTAVNGFKNLFKKSEIENVMKRLYENGWITEEEYKSYMSSNNQNFLNKTSKNIENQRKNNVKNKTKKTTKKKK